jgi:hypothetical protein
VSSILPANLQNLHQTEEQLRGKALAIIAQDKRLQMHLMIIERAMDLADMLRQYPTEDEDLKVAKVLGMRTFNAFGASLKLALSGYGQNSALVIRDVIETVFLLDLFRGDRLQIQRWRFADSKTLRKEFSPVAVRRALDVRDGLSSGKRAELYKLFSELAAHPTMKSSWMMRPQKDGDAVIGPFIEQTTLEAVISEMGRLAVQLGAVLDQFIPGEWSQGRATRLAFAQAKIAWMATFSPTTKGS